MPNKIGMWGRPERRVVYHGQDMLLSEAVARAGNKVSPVTARRRLDRGYTVEGAVETPSREASTPSKFKKQYCEDVVPFLEAGHSVEAFAGKCDTDVWTIYAWRREHEDFDAAVRRGQAKALKHYEGKLLAAIDGEKKLENYQFHALKWHMLNRCREAWSDKQTTELVGSGSLIKVEVSRDPKTMNDDELDAIIDAGMKAKEILSATALPTPDDDGEE